MWSEEFFVLGYFFSFVCEFNTTAAVYQRCIILFSWILDFKLEINIYGNIEGIFYGIHWGPLRRN